jgi:plastocyanin
MRAGIAAAFACGALVLAAGCGSSSKPAASSAGTTTASSTSTATTSATSTAKGTASTHSYSTGPKADTTPKFAAPSPSAAVQSGVVQIAYRNITIEPDTVRVKVGSTVRWTNYDSVKANVTSVGGGPQHIAYKNFGEGGSFEVKLNSPGVIHYECTLYPVTMNGTIEVVS